MAIVERHTPSNCVSWRWDGYNGELMSKVYDGTFAYNPYSGAVTFHRWSTNYNMGFACSPTCARKIVKGMVSKGEVIYWIPPTDAELDRGGQGRNEKLHMPEWSADYTIQRARCVDGRMFCQCGECEMPESFRFTHYPCRVSCSAYLLP